MTYAQAVKLKSDALVIHYHRYKNRINGISIGTIKISENGLGYFCQIAPYKDSLLQPVMDWKDYKVMNAKEQAAYVLWRFGNE